MSTLHELLSQILRGVIARVPRELAERVLQSTTAGILDRVAGLLELLQNPAKKQRQRNKSTCEI